MTTSPGDDGQAPAPASRTSQRPAATRWVIRILKVAGFVLVGLIVAFAIFFLWASSGDSNTELVSAGEVFENADGAAPPADPKTLTVVSFNIGYARGPAGDNAGPWEASVFTDNLEHIARQVGDAQADVVFLQEVDLQAARSHDIDQGKVLLDKLGWKHGTCVVTWEKNYVPFPYWPPSKHYGRMKSGQCVLSKFPIAASTRYRMPKPEANAWWRNMFYLDRAVDHVKLVIHDQSWDVFNVHLEAFDVPNRMEHARFLVDLVNKEAHSDRVVVAGDFNALPVAAAQKKGFIDEPEADFSADTTHDLVTQGLPNLHEVMPDVGVFTFPADAPTRRLDYIWYGPSLVLDEARVLTVPPGPWSDHLAIAARFTLVR